MSITHELTRRADGKHVLTITMDTDDDALLLSAALGSVSMERIREVATMMQWQVQAGQVTPGDKIKILLDRPGFNSPVYAGFDKLLTALRIK